MKSTEALLPLDTIRAMSGWKDIDRAEQAELMEEIRGLEGELIAGANSRLAVGKHLAAIQEKLSPRKMFTNFLRAYNFKKSTAHKAVTSYKNASAWLPEAVLTAAAARNMNMLGESPEAPVGVYSNCVRRLPPPDSKDPKKINEWLDSVELARRREIARTRKRIDEVEIDEDVALKECFQFVNRRLSKMPSRSKARTLFLERLAGMLLRQTGVSVARTIEPQAPPEEFVRGAGRPKTIEGTAA